MRKIIILLLVLITSMAANSAYAVTTLFLGSSIDGEGKTNDYINSKSYSGEISDLTMDFTNISEIKKIKTDIDYERGDFKYNDKNPTMGLWDAQVGFPLISKDKGLVYVTLGGVSYNEYGELNPKNEASSSMLGLNVVGTPVERFQFELGIQHSLWDGSSKLHTETGDIEHSSVAITACKVKVQYIFTDNFGFAVHYRVLDIKENDREVSVVNINTTTAGFIYRF